MGDIGVPKRVIEFEPLPESVPFEEDPAPIAPPLPAREPEKVPG